MLYVSNSVRTLRGSLERIGQVDRALTLALRDPRSMRPVHREAHGSRLGRLISTETAGQGSKATSGAVPNVSGSLLPTSDLRESITRELFDVDAKLVTR